MTDPPHWFAPKRIGYGAGLPIAWQGWAMLSSYLVLILLAGWLLSPWPALFLSILIPATAMLIIVSARTTRGGWRWRWGDPD
jgi:hypothetical protein